MAGARSALIVATYAYDDPGLTRLRAPERDADALIEVLGDPDIGGFEVSSVVNEPAHEVNVAVAEFFANRRSDDLLLLHFSCHGVKDDSGELYLAAQNTKLDLLEATATSSTFVRRAMDRSRAGRVVLLLDCCYAGAFGRGMSTRAGGGVDIQDRLAGRGRAVIAASSALEFAFEETELVKGDAAASRPSVFTGAVVQGLRSGEADRDQNGWVSLDELYAYVHDEVTRVNPKQNPKKWALDVEGDLYVARRGQPVTQPSELPASIRESLASHSWWERKSVVEPLTELLHGDHPGLALAASVALGELAGDPDDRVKGAARAILSEAPAGEPAAAGGPERQAPPAQAREERATEERATEERARDEHATEEPLGPAGPVSPAEEAGNGTQGVRTDEPGKPTQDGPARDRLVERPGEQEEPAGTGEDRRTGSGSGGRPRWAVPVAAAAVVAVSVGGLWALNNGRDGGGGGGGGGDGDGESLALPVSELLVTSTPDPEGPATLLAVDTESPGSTPRRILTRDGLSRPTIDTGREWMVYLQDGDRGTQPRLARVDGSEEAPLLSPAASETCPQATRPTWSPDGSRMALVCLGQNGSPLGIWTVDVQTGDLIAQVVGGDRLTGAPTWAAENAVVYGRSAETEGGPDTLWAVAVDGSGEPTQLTFGEDGSDSHPDWDDPGLLFLRSPTPDLGHGDVWLMNEAGRLTQLTFTGDVESPAWGPAGTSFTYLRKPGPEGRGLWVQPVGGEPVDLELSGKLGPPAWGSR